MIRGDIGVGEGIVDLSFERNGVSLQKDNAYGDRLTQNNDLALRAEGTNAGRRMAVDATESIQGISDRSDIRVYEKGLGVARDEYSEHGEREIDAKRNPKGW